MVLAAEDAQHRHRTPHVRPVALLKRIVHANPSSQEKTAIALSELEVHNISTAPKFGLSLAQLRAAADDDAVAEQLYSDMREALGAHRKPSFMPQSTPQGGVEVHSFSGPWQDYMREAQGMHG